jgi:MOSC domain-containing protein YiiM
MSVWIGKSRRRTGQSNLDATLASVASFEDKIVGAVVSIHVASANGGDLINLREATLVAGEGIRGDRNFGAGEKDPAKELSLVEAEQVEHFNRVTGLSIEPQETRRNVVTRGIALADLVGQQFVIGEVVAEAIDLSEPCKLLGDRLQTDEVSSAAVIKAFAGRAGVRARIVRGGVIRPGDEIVPQIDGS